MIDVILDVLVFVLATIVILAALLISVGLSLLLTGWIWLGVQSVWGTIF